MFDRISPKYDLVNRLMTFGLDPGWRREVVRRLALGEYVSMRAQRELFEREITIEAEERGRAPAGFGSRAKGIRCGLRYGRLSEASE